MEENQKFLGISKIYCYEKYNLLKIPKKIYESFFPTKTLYYYINEGENSLEFSFYPNILFHRKRKIYSLLQIRLPKNLSFSRDNKVFWYSEGKKLLAKVYEKGKPTFNIFINL